MTDIESGPGEPKQTHTEAPGIAEMHAMAAELGARQQRTVGEAVTRLAAVQQQGSEGVDRAAQEATRLRDLPKVDEHSPLWPDQH